MILCSNDTCGEQVDEDFAAPGQKYCSIECREEAAVRAKVDERIWLLDSPEEPAKSPLSVRRREKALCFWCNSEFTGSPLRRYCSAACKVAAWRKGIRPKSDKTRADRFSILERDGFRCRYCGRTAREDGVKLHVDHIYPLSKGGASTEDNLITACQECNLGKNDRVLLVSPQ